VLLVPAVGGSPEPGESGWATTARAAVHEAAGALPDAEVRWYPGADHDLHAQHPRRLAVDLLALEARVAAQVTAPVPPPEESSR
jgi:hypothetical protein